MLRSSGRTAPTSALFVAYVSRRILGGTYGLPGCVIHRNPMASKSSDRVIECDTHGGLTTATSTSCKACARSQLPRPMVSRLDRGKATADA